LAIELTLLVGAEADHDSGLAQRTRKMPAVVPMSCMYWPTSWVDRLVVTSSFHAVLTSMTTVTGSPSGGDGVDAEVGAFADAGGFVAADLYLSVDDGVVWGEFVGQSVAEVVADFVL
jgi:hypothetical protein